MILELGSDNLSVEFHFELYRTFGKTTLVNNKIQPVKDIVVYMSGGLDSTALLCLVLTKYIGIKPIRAVTLEKNDFSIQVSSVVLKAVSKKFGVYIEHTNHIENDIKDRGLLSGKSIQKLTHDNYGSLFVMGNNNMPPETIKKFKNKIIYYGEEIYNPHYVSPFLHLHKPQILDIFYKLNCEDIIPYTYSCTVQPNIPCNNCYACEERRWGFEMLGKVDPLVTQNQLTAN